jgi:uncharacterized damage-inducible protein DinB
MANMLRHLWFSPNETLNQVWLRVLVEHEIHHRAQLTIYLNLLNVKTPAIFGLTAEEIRERSIEIPT